MKKIFEKFGKLGIVAMILIALVTMFAFGQVIYDLRNALTYTAVLTPRTSVAADTSSAIDISPYIGKVVLIQTITGATGSTITYTSKVQHSTDGTTFTAAPTDSAFTDFTSSADATTGETQYKTLDTRKVRRYLRYITTLSASDTIQVGVLMLSQARNR